MSALTTKVSSFPTAFDEKTVFQFVRFEKRTRYYSIILEQDLFKDWVITIVNGRINSKLGRIRKLVFSNSYDALEKFHGIITVRTKRGYYHVTTHDSFYKAPGKSKKHQPSINVIQDFS